MKRILLIILICLLLPLEVFASYAKVGADADFDGDVGADYFYGDGSNLTNVGAAAATAVSVTAKEENTSALVKGQPVYVSGSTGAAFPEVGLADCDDPNKIQVIGLAGEAITQNLTGLIRIQGLLPGVDSLGTNVVNPSGQTWSAGDMLFLHATAGGLTNVEPTIGRVIHIGWSLYGSSNTDAILVVPMIPHAHIEVATGEDIILRLGDSAGTNIVCIKDYTNTEVAQINSDGVADFEQTTVTNLVVDGTTASGIEITGANTTAQIYIHGSDILATGEQAIYVNAPSETNATNGMWISLGSTVVTGDVTGARIKVTTNAVSGGDAVSGQNVRGVYAQAIVAANDDAGLLQAGLFVADVSAGSCVAYNVHILTGHYSAGASAVIAGDLYVGYLRAQSRSTNPRTVTGNDCLLALENEAVEGAGQIMNSAIRIFDTNMGVDGFDYGIDMSDADITTADIILSDGGLITGSTNYIYPQMYATGAGTSGDPWVGWRAAAYAACPTGGTIYFRAGYYELDAALTITKAISIVGEGIGRTFIVTADAHGIYINDEDYITIKNLTIDADATTDSESYKCGITISLSDYIILENIEIKESIDLGVDANGCNYITLTNIYAHDNLSHGIHAGTDTSGTNRYNTYQNIYAWDNTGGGFDDRGNDANYPDEDSRNTYDNLRCWDNAGHGISITGHHESVLSNSFSINNGLKGIYLVQMEDFFVDDCYVELSDEQGIYLQNSDNVTFTNVILKNNNMDDGAVGGMRIRDSNGTKMISCQSYDERIVSDDDIAFVEANGGEDTITQVSATFLEQGFIAGGVITITGDSDNNGVYTIVSVVAGTINVATGELTAEAAGDDVVITHSKIQDWGIVTEGTNDYIEFINCDFRGNLTSRIYNFGSSPLKGMDVHTLTEDHDYSGKWKTGVLGETVVFGQLLYFNFADDWKETDADVAATMPGLRIALEGGDDGETILMLIEGDIRDDSFYEFAASMVYAGTDVGAIVSTAPSGSGDQIQRVGVAESADAFYFNPSLDQGEI